MPPPEVEAWQCGSMYFQIDLTLFKLQYAPPPEDSIRFDRHSGMGYSGGRGVSPLKYLGSLFKLCFQI